MREVEYEPGCLPDSHEREPDKPERDRRPDDPVIRLAARLDRVVQDMPQWARRWAIGFLQAKYLSSAQENHDAVP